MQVCVTSNARDWVTAGGDAWAARWRDTDQALSGLAPALHSAVLAAAPPEPFTAFDVGCGPGSTSLAIALARPDARLIACDLSPALVAVARERLRDIASVEVVLGDAQAVALDRGPFDLIYSRHGVMFFPDPFAAFGVLRRAATDSARIVFSCFQSWGGNPWASELASAAAGKHLPSPGREPSGFAFADPDYVRDILRSAGWKGADLEAVAFPYVAGRGELAVEQALAFLCEIGPASGVIRALPNPEREEAWQRMRAVIERYFDGNKVEFEAAAWIWVAVGA